MTEQRSNKIQQIIWKRKASELREKLWQNSSSLLTILQANFQDKNESQEFGNLFWKLANEKSEIIVPNFTYCKKILQPNCWEGSKIVLLHKWTNDCGVIVTLLSEICTHSDEIYQTFGPDFLFMDPKGKFGFCYEEGEDENVIRKWGCLCNLVA